MRASSTSSSTRKMSSRKPPDMDGGSGSTWTAPPEGRSDGCWRSRAAITAAATLTGDIDKALYWFRNEPIADYGQKTAAELVAEGRLEAVFAYLRDLANGANG